MLVIFNVKAQNTPIDDFLKKYPSREGVTTVSLSQQILQSYFDEDKNRKAPESYSSITVSKNENAFEKFTNFNKMVVSSKYEKILEVNKENSDIVCYYVKKMNKGAKETIVSRQQKDMFSAIYIKGDIEIDDLDWYLTTIKRKTKLKILLFIQF